MTSIRAFTYRKLAIASLPTKEGPMIHLSFTITIKDTHYNLFLNLKLTSSFCLISICCLAPWLPSSTRTQHSSRHMKFLVLRFPVLFCLYCTKRDTRLCNFNGTLVETTKRLCPTFTDMCYCVVVFAQHFWNNLLFV